MSAKFFIGFMDELTKLARAITPPSKQFAKVGPLGGQLIAATAKKTRAKARTALPPFAGSKVTKARGFRTLPRTATPTKWGDIAARPAPARVPGDAPEPGRTIRKRIGGEFGPARDVRTAKGEPIELASIGRKSPLVEAERSLRTKMKGMPRSIRKEYKPLKPQKYTDPEKTTSRALARYTPKQLATFAATGRLAGGKGKGKGKRKGKRKGVIAPPATFTGSRLVPKAQEYLARKRAMGSLGPRQPPPRYKRVPEHLDPEFAMLTPGITGGKLHGPAAQAREKARKAGKPVPPPRKPGRWKFDPAKARFGHGEAQLRAATKYKPWYRKMRLQLGMTPGVKF